MVQKARVTSVNSDGTATVEVKRTSACAHDCDDCEGCSTMIKAADIFIVAQNCAAARVGDSVEIESESGKVLGIAAALYLLPLLVFIAVYLIASPLGTMAYLIAGAAFIASFAPAVICNRRAHVSYTITRVL
ncbi:MAG: SoxR reducing system RseC family protein [Clostridia bacterium]